jgi:3-oxoacyl-[acyl-carrier protein] reductase
MSVTVSTPRQFHSSIAHCAGLVEKEETMIDINFDGKNVLVVGGSSGIGNGIAHGFKAQGANVHVWGTRPNAVDYAGTEGSDLSGLGYTSVNVADASLVDAAPDPFATLDVLVLSQGFVLYRRAEFVMHCSRRFYPQLKASGGALIIVNSTSGFQANIGNPAYAASKAGAVSLTKTLGKAWAKDGIRVNGIAPGLVDTKLTKVTTGNPARRESALSKIAAGRLGTPDDIAGAAIFLASPLASYVNGHTLVVDGGLTL